jgi:hypothetical protein
MTEQDLLDEAKARANIATQKMNEQFHNESVKSESEVTERCIYCDGTGEVHGVDGEWRGTCTECKS